MTSFISSLALVVVAASSNSAAAVDSSRPDLSFAREVLTELSAALGHPNPEHLGAGDWTSALACTANLETTPGLIDQSACATTQASDGGDCVWCDSSALIGTGVCVGPDIKDKTGAAWDFVCGSSADGSTPAAVVAAVPARDASSATLGDNGLPDMVKCSLDESYSVVADEATCVAREDAAGENCVWCGVSFLGSGACTTNNVKTTIGFLCSAAEEKGMTRTKGKTYLRGVDEEGAVEDHL